MLDYGTKTTKESYYNHELKSTKVEYSIPILVQDKNQVLTEIINALELITSHQTHKLTITVETDPKTHYFRLLTKQYMLDL